MPIDHNGAPASRSVIAWQEASSDQFRHTPRPGLIPGRTPVQLPRALTAVIKAFRKPRMTAAASPATGSLSETLNPDLGPLLGSQVLGLWWAGGNLFLTRPFRGGHSEHQAETCQRLNGSSSATGRSCGRSQRVCLGGEHQLIFPLLAPLALGLSSLLGGPAPTVDASVIAVLGMFVFSIFPGSALGEEVVGEASHCPISRTITGL
jgi:hypothetical protein